MDNFYYCPICGALVYTYQIHECLLNQQVGWIEPMKCNHCYCIPDWGQGTTNPHRRCCKCGDIKAEQFIPSNNIPYENIDRNNISEPWIMVFDDGKLSVKNIEDYKYKKVSYVAAMDYFPNCRTCDCGFYTDLKFFKSLKELLTFAVENYNDYELKGIHTSTGKLIGKIEYKTSYHNIDYLEIKFKYLKLRTKDNGYGSVIWERI